MVTWWNDKNIEVVEIEGRYIALYGWNGECYTDCWEVGDIHSNVGFKVAKSDIMVEPIYKEVGEDYDIIGYEIVWEV